MHCILWAGLHAIIRRENTEPSPVLQSEGLKSFHLSFVHSMELLTVVSDAFFTASGSCWVCIILQCTVYMCAYTRRISFAGALSTHSAVLK